VHVKVKASLLYPRKLVQTLVANVEMIGPEASLPLTYPIVMALTFVKAITIARPQITPVKVRPHVRAKVL
jgi:hypothetical protein